MNKLMRVFTLKVFMLTIVLLSISSCKIQLVTPYDEVIDNGLKEYKENINTLLKNLADNNGKETGTFESNSTNYNELEAKIDVLIDRAQLQSNGDCKVIAQVADRLNTQLLNLSIPITTVKKEKESNSYGCTAILLTNIKKQLEILKKIHSTTDKCDDGNGNKISCLRETTSKDALEIINQAINAAWVVETAKKNLE